MKTGATSRERAAFSFPVEGCTASGRPWRAGPLVGRAYGAIEAQLELVLPRWLEAGDVSEGEPLKPPHVFRAGELVVKFFPPPSLLGRLRRPRAVRSAEQHFRCLPVPTPRPLVALTCGRAGASLLVREFVAGRLLSEVGGGDEAAERALAETLAGMHRQGVLHGDLHPRNLLWTGARWVLLDVDGVRHGLHSPSRVLAGQWARLLLHLGDERRIERLFRRASELCPEDARLSWPGVLERARRMRASRAPSPEVRP